ncbi:MAG: GNAT family N-acetyltransferase [Alphaproteobacteria bacterium]|nr:GNAT family N-acetyltransferase [Alphaproteobacteria bacterium]
MTTFRLEPAADAAATEARWRALEDRLAPPFFLTWPWMSAWLGVTGVRPQLLVGRADDSDVALGFIGGGPAADGTIALNETGVAAREVGYIEYNGLLSGLAPESLADGVLACLLGARSAGPLRGWRALALSGVPVAWSERCRAAGLVVELRAEQRCYAVDLDALRRSGSDVLSTLSANARQQLRRARRLYEAEGALAVTRVAPGSATDEALAELIALHQARWIADGRPGAFAAPLFEPFVRQLIARSRPGGPHVEILRIAAGSRTIGLLLNLVAHGRIANYLSGFVAEDDNRRKPGLVSHLAAIDHHLAAGAACYDLLAGDARYKETLATPHATLVWLTVRPRTVSTAIGALGRIARRAGGRALRMVSRSS